MNKIFSKGVNILGMFFSVIIILGLGYYIVRNELTPKYQTVVVEPGKIEFSRNLSGEITALETSKIITKGPIKVKNTYVETGEFVKQGTELIEIELVSNASEKLNDDQKQMEILRVRNQIEDNSFQIKQLDHQLKAIEVQHKDQKLLYEQGAVTAESYKEIAGKIERIKDEISFKVAQEEYYLKQIELIKNAVKDQQKESLFFANTEGLVKKVGNSIIAQQDLYIINIATLGTDLYSGAELIAFAAVDSENIAIKCSVLDDIREKFENADVVQLIADGKAIDMTVIKKVNQKPMQVYLKPETDLNGKMIGQQVAVRFKCTVDASSVVPVSSIIPDKLLKEGENGAVYVVEKHSERDDLYEVRREDAMIEFVGDKYVALKLSSGGTGMVIVKAPESSDIEDMKVRIYD